MIVVAILTVKRAELESFRAFETAAVAIMREHAGRLERTAVIDDGSSEQLKEIHWIWFPNADAFAAYRASPKLSELRALRDASVTETELFVGSEGPAY